MCVVHTTCVESSNGEQFGVYALLKEKKGKKRGSRHVTLNWLTLTDTETALRDADQAAAERVQELIRQGADPAERQSA